MTARISPDELLAATGRTLGVSDWLVVDQTRVNAFADVTDDHQYIHTDPARAARETPFGGAIAHGFLTLSMLSHLAEEVVPVLAGLQLSINYGFDRIRFLEPVRVGDAIRARFSVRSAEEKSAGRWLITFDVTIEIEGREKPALIAEWLTMQVTGEA